MTFSWPPATYWENGEFANNARCNIVSYAQTHNIMKIKIIILFCTLICSHLTIAQSDTLRWGQRDPRYIYRGYSDVYPDSIYYARECVTVPVWTTGWENCDTQIGKLCSTPTPVDIVGIAAFTWVDSTVYPNFLTLIYPRVPDILQLYEITDTGFVLLAEEGEHYVKKVEAVCPGDSLAYYELHEAYFEKPVRVADSFLAVMKICNGRNDFVPEGCGYPATNYTNLLFINAWFLPEGPTIKSDPIYYFWNVTPPTPFVNGWTREYSYAHLCLFPIMDTAGMGLGGGATLSYGPYRCGDVSNPRVLDVSDNTATISWTPYNHSPSLWEVAYWPQGTAQKKYQYSNTLFTTLRNLDTATRYMARIRTICDSCKDMWGHWSDTLEFYVAGDTTHSQHDTTGITNVERYTSIMPNPCNNKATIFSSYHLSRITIFALNGTVMEDRKCEALSSDFDVSQYPCGTYVVYITTPAGTCVKKLVVE